MDARHWTAPTDKSIWPEISMKGHGQRNETVRTESDGNAHHIIQGKECLGRGSHDYHDYKDNSQYKYFSFFK